MASLKDLLGRFSSVNKPALSLEDESVPLPAGKTMGEVLRRLYENRSSCLPPAHKPLPPSSSYTIAICVVIVDKLHHEEVWREWLQTGKLDSDQPEYWAELFIHAKHPDRITSPWVQARTLDHSFHPEWNSPEVVRAVLSTLDAALHYTSPDGRQCGRFVLATESCLPLYSLQHTGQQLFAAGENNKNKNKNTSSQDKSWLAAYDTPRNRYEAAHCFQAMSASGDFPAAAVWKSLPGWVMLTRPHVAEVIALVQRLGGWRPGSSSGGTPEGGLVEVLGPPGPWNESKGGVHAPEEIFFPSLLAVLGYLRKNGDDQVVRQAVTFAEWRRNGDANPVRYEEWSEDVVRGIRTKAPAALFARKFAPQAVTGKTWREVVLGQRRTKKRRAEERDGDGQGDEERGEGS